MIKMIKIFYNNFLYLFFGLILYLNKNIISNKFNLTTQKPLKILKLERGNNNHNEMIDIFIINGIIKNKTYTPSDLEFLLKEFSKNFIGYLNNTKYELKNETINFILSKNELQTKNEYLENEQLWMKQLLLIICLILLIILFINFYFIKYVITKYNQKYFKHIRMNNVPPSFFIFTLLYVRESIFRMYNKL
ncbi:hypothetical protein Mgra_00002618 [Meloidogyne graminicola]|uniref:Uncharacterized protein n=1 Tax=Meloidogyne graminicola TaxID=189291 RepID=A0A8S9ZY39_9BILA|nr:hypothetical protein Mgra_00002618 [Meloidogyne graminicola]